MNNERQYANQTLGWSYEALGKGIGAREMAPEKLGSSSKAKTACSSPVSLRTPSQLIWVKRGSSFEIRQKRNRGREGWVMTQREGWMES